MNKNLENKFICKYCGRIFKRQCDLSLHINITHLKITKLSRKTKECIYCHKNISILSFNKHFKILFGKDLIGMAKYVASKYNIKFNDKSNKINGNFKDLYDK